MGFIPITMTHHINPLFLCFLITGLFGCSNKTTTVKTVDFVDINKYSGKWYEIASFPQSFQKGCHNTTAVYSPGPDGNIIVENRCNKDSLTGKESYIKGKAFVVPNSGNARLKVQFFWPFKGDYWIIDLAEDYAYAAVGSPNKKYLWILSRKNVMDEETYAQLLKKLQGMGFDINRLQKTKHSIK